jgi:carbamate kinase
MNTQLAFAFGMLAMVAITMLVVIVVGMVKVIRHDKNFKNLREEIGNIYRHTSDTERHIYQEINQVRINLDRTAEEFRRDTQAYTDSRIDKALETTKKQLLKD